MAAIVDGDVNGDFFIVFGVSDNFIDMGTPDDYEKLCERYEELD